MSTAAKIILAIVGVFILLIVGCVGLLFFAHQQGSNVQEDFYEAVLAGDAAALKARFAPEIQDDIDEPVLAAWMASVKENLGAFKGMSPSHFSTSIKNTNGRKIVESTGTAEFEKGTAESKLVLVDGKIVEWHTKSEALKGNWFTKLDDPSYYDAKSQALLKAMLAAETETVRGMVSESLRKQLMGPEFGALLGRIKAYYAPSTGITRSSHTFEAGPPQKLIMRFTAAGMPSNPDGSAAPELTVTWSFDGMRGVLNGFNVPMSSK